MLIKTLKDCQGFIAGDGCTLREYFHPDKENLSLRYSLAWALVAPGQITRPHTLKTSEVYYILTGRGMMHIQQETHQVSAGDAIYIPPHTVQYIQNISDTDLTFLCIVDPAWRSEDERIL